MKRLWLVLVLALLLAFPALSAAQADDGNGGTTDWGSFFDADGNLLPGVKDLGVQTVEVPWMPQLPDWAVPASEQEIRKSNYLALAEARKSRTEKALTELGYESPAPDPTPEDGNGHENPGELIVHFGRNQGKKLAEIWASEEGRGWIRWAAGDDGKGKGFEPKDEKGKHLQRMAKAFLMLNAAYAG
jgi:hypothetical protein